MAERTVIVVLEVPFLETFSMENVEAFQFSDFLGTEHRFEADDTYELIIGTIRGERRSVSPGPPFLEGTDGRDSVELTQLVGRVLFATFLGWAALATVEVDSENQTHDD